MYNEMNNYFNKSHTILQPKIHVFAAIKKCLSNKRFTCLRSSMLLNNQRHEFFFLPSTMNINPRRIVNSRQRSSHATNGRIPLVTLACVLVAWLSWGMTNISGWLILGLLVRRLGVIQEEGFFFFVSCWVSSWPREMTSILKSTVRTSVPVS